MSSSVRSEKKNGRPKSSVLLLCAVVRLAADVVDVDVAQAGGGGVSHLRVVVDGDVAVEDLLEEVFIVGNGEVLHGPGSGRQADSILSNAQGGGSIADLVPGAIVNLGDRPLGSVAQALHSGGDDGLGLAGLVDVDADDLAVLSGSGSGDGLEHGTAAGEDDLSAVGVPAGDHGLQLGGSLEGSAVLPGVVQVDGLIHFLSSVVGALSKAPAVTDAGGVRAAAAAGEAELLIAFLDDSVTGEVAALLFVEGDARNVVKAEGPTVDEDELGVGEFLSSLLEGRALHEAGADDDLGAAVHGSLHGVVTVVIGRLIAVGGLIVLVAQAVVGGIELHAVEGALVEGLILQLADVGDERDLILAVFGRHVVVDIVRIGVSGGPALLIVSVGVALIVVGLLITAGNEGQNHDESEKQRKKLLHSSILPYFSGRRRAAFRFILKCGRTSSDSIAKAKGRIKSDSPRFYFFCDN